MRLGRSTKDGGRAVGSGPRNWLASSCGADSHSQRTGTHHFCSRARNSSELGAHLSQSPARVDRSRAAHSIPVRTHRLLVARSTLGPPGQFQEARLTRGHDMMPHRKPHEGRKRLRREYQKRNHAHHLRPGSTSPSRSRSAFCSSPPSSPRTMSTRAATTSSTTSTTETPSSGASLLAVTLHELAPGGQSYTFVWSIAIEPLYDITVSPLRFILKSPCDLVGNSEPDIHWLNADGSRYKRRSPQCRANPCIQRIRPRLHRGFRRGRTTRSVHLVVGDRPVAFHVSSNPDPGFENILSGPSRTVTILKTDEGVAVHGEIHLYDHRHVTLVPGSLNAGERGWFGRAPLYSPTQERSQH